jgi:hypothetical protein
MYPFGTDFTLPFTPFADGVEAALPSQTAELFVYTSRPSRTQVLAETGHTYTTTVSVVAGATSFSFAVTSIDDPAPSAEQPSQRYWYAVKFKLDTDEDQQIVIRELFMERVSGQSKTLTVTPQDLITTWKAVASFHSAEAMLNAISVENTLIRARMKSKGYEWAQLFRPDFLKNALIFAALALLMEGEAHEDYEELVKQWRKASIDLADMISGEIPVDSDDDGEPDTVVAASNFVVVSR